MTPSARLVLRGEVTLMLRVPAEPVRRGKVARSSRPGADRAPPLPLDDVGLALFAELKAWRAEVAREHGLPAYVIFHDATLAEMARERPATLDDLAGISGVGAKKLQAYGQEILRVIQNS
jgi:ATP-dependent DNA helicase RecQ